jgi:hypothetical protein
VSPGNGDLTDPRIPALSVHRYIVPEHDSVLMSSRLSTSHSDACSEFVIRGLATLRADIVTCRHEGMPRGRGNSDTHY